MANEVRFELRANGAKWALMDGELLVDTGYVTNPMAFVVLPETLQKLCDTINQTRRSE